MCQFCGPDHPTKGELTKVNVYDYGGKYLYTETLWLCEKHAERPALIRTEINSTIYWTW